LIKQKPEKNQQLSVVYDNLKRYAKPFKSLEAHISK